MAELSIANGAPYRYCTREMPALLTTIGAAVNDEAARRSHGGVAARLGC